MTELQWKYKRGQRVIFRPFTHLNPMVGFEAEGTILSVFLDGGKPAYSIETEREVFTIVKQEDIVEKPDA